MAAHYPNHQTLSLGEALRVLDPHEKVNQFFNMRSTVHQTSLSGDNNAANSEGLAPELVQLPSLGPLLPCISFLSTHFDQGGLNKQGYNMLYRMIQMMSAIGWEVHVIHSSRIPSGGAKANMDWYGKCILQGCEVFRSNIEASVKKAMDAIESLQALDETDAALPTKMKQWQWKLRFLHEPTGNDRRLFKLVSKHFDQTALQPLAQLNSRHLRYGLARIVETTKSVSAALEELSRLAEQADKLVLSLDRKFMQATSVSLRTESEQPCLEQLQRAADRESPALLEPGVYQTPTNELSAQSKPMFSKSFGVAEEELARRGHARAATFSEIGYTTALDRDAVVEPKLARPYQGLGVGARRKGTNVPRIFTGSFSQLESDIRRLHIDKVQTPEIKNIEDADPVKVRDFGATPVVSPCPTPSPLTLQRREALVSRDIEFQDRIINGEVVKSRRPSTKVRAHTIDDTTSGLEAWLNEKPTRRQVPDAQDLGVRRGGQRHRENTL